MSVWMLLGAVCAAAMFEHTIDVAKSNLKSFIGVCIWFSLCYVCDNVSGCKVTKSCEKTQNMDWGRVISRGIRQIGRIRLIDQAGR